MKQPHLAPTPEELTRLREGLRILALHVLRDAEAAEEAAQESMTRLLQALREDRLVDPSRLGAFARAIARHVLTDVLRARQRDLALQRLHAPEATSGDALSSLVSAEEAARVHAALADLPSADRDLLRLSFFDGLTPAEIAAQIGEPATRIRKRKERALDRLRQAFLAGPRHATPPSPTSSRETNVIVDERGGGL